MITDLSRKKLSDEDEELKQDLIELCSDFCELQNRIDHFSKLLLEISLKYDRKWSRDD